MRSLQLRSTVGVSTAYLIDHGVRESLGVVVKARLSQMCKDLVRVVFGAFA